MPTIELSRKTLRIFWAFAYNTALIPVAAGVLYALTTAALDALGLKILGEHVSNCIADAFASGDASAAREKSEELLAAVERFTRTR
ncbi:MAG: hypothetical protein ACRDNG_07310 [Gaiellaceae bacterium]